MAIDMRSEKLIRLADVPKLPWLPLGPNGKAVARPTVHRWAKDGEKGVKLETVNAPVLCTTEAAVMRFFERISAPPEEKPKRAATRE